MLISWVIQGLTSWMPHRRTLRNFTHQTWAIWDLSNHDLFWIIPDPGRQKTITPSLESISTIPCQAGTSYVKIPEWGQHCSNRRMPCIMDILGTFRGTWNQRNENAGAPDWCTADIFSNVTNRDIQRPGMLIAWKLGQVSLVGCTNDWHNRRSGRKLILHIPPAVAVAPCIFYSNWLPMSPCFCGIRGTCQIRLLMVNCFFIGSIFRWWRTRYIVYG